MVIYLVVFEDKLCELVDMGSVYLVKERADAVARGYQTLYTDRTVVVVKQWVNTF